MNIGIFSKFEMCGGSEFRGCELANGLIKFTEHTVTLIVRGPRMPEGLKNYLDPSVTVVQDALNNPDIFYKQDAVLTINTDSKDFTTSDFWDGKSAQGPFVVDLARIPKMAFLFNFLVSPSRHLSQIVSRGPKVGIITTNTRFYDEITKQDRYDTVKALPRIRLESPISEDRHDFISRPVNSSTLVVGMHSKGLGNKWNEDLPYVIKKINDRFKESNPFSFQFMGMSGERRKDFEKAKFANVKIYRENEVQVREFLNTTDIFMFMPSWKREEPWARVVAEAMMSGCPILGTDKGGNKDQIIHHHNGYLCKRKDDFFKNLCHLSAHRDLITHMGENSRRRAITEFRTELIVKKLVAFLQNL
jgi:glycosyltransferase involved in cell wall biosynthesis